MQPVLTSTLAKGATGKPTIEWLTHSDPEKKRTRDLGKQYLRKLHNENGENVLHITVTRIVTDPSISNGMESNGIREFNK